MAATVALVTGCSTRNDEPRRVTVPPGSSFAAAAESLHTAGVIGSPRAFRMYATLRGRDRDLKAGTYEISPGASWGEVIETLAAGRGVQARVTIPEGWQLREIVPHLARALGVSEDSVAAAASDSALRERLGVPTPTLEGYLFPDTYLFSQGTPARDAIRELVRRFENVWDAEWDTRLQELGMTRHQIVTLASIVEKEARVADERPVIAAVYHNRLRIGMPLQADPTVQYALGRHTERVLFEHLEIESRYNTYRNAGLPPGPIASPGRASIEAALHPADVRYLYFVARPDGRHEFRRTFDEHRRARDEIRRQQRAGSAAPRSGGN
jgi:UPF0755 protein